MTRVSRSAFVAGAAASLLAPSSHAADAANDEDALFMQIANAAADRFGRTPPYVSYRVSGTLHAFRGDGTFEHRVMVRMADGKAITDDELRAPFPAMPNFDALSHWTLDMDFNRTATKNGPMRTVDAGFTNIAPLRYRTDLGSRADAIVNTIRGYKLRRLSDEPGGIGHLGLERSDKNAHDASLRDVYFALDSLLPTRVQYDGKDDFRLDAGYRVVEGCWLLDDLRFGYTAYAFAHLARASFACDTTFADYAFPQSAPDPRLA